MAAPLGTKVGSAFFEVVASFAGFGESLTSGVTNAITTRGLILGDAMERLGKTLFTRFTIPFGIAAAANLAQFQALERGIAETLTLFGTAPSLIDETFGSMTEGIRGVSEAVGGLERDISDGLYQTISAGVPKGNAFDFLEVAQMAAIADKTAELTDTVDGITTAINAYGLEFSQAAEVSDMFFATVARGKTTFGEISQTLGRVAPLAANAGVKLGETLAIMGQLTVQGLKTSEAVSFLRAAISGILRPSDAMNDIFNKIGFASAEAAIPVIGLQKAFQTVVDAAGGSTSKLQELIGTSEGVTAILGITGDNAGNFASVLDSVENSAGRASDAFGIVDGTVSRSFGKMTEAFDRLGNLFGGVAAEFAQPVVDAITSVVSSLVNMFAGLAPLLTNIAGGFGRIFAVFNVPVVREIVALFAAFLISMGGILGLLGPMIFGFGILAKNIVIAGTALGVFRAATPALGILGRLTDTIGKKVVELAQHFKGADFASKNMNKTFTFLGKTMQLSIRSLVGLGAGVLAFTAVAIAAAAVAKEWADNLGEIDAQSLITTKGIDKLGESLGIALDPLKAMVAEGEAPHDIVFAFTLENEALLKGLERTLEKLGPAAAEEQVISIAFQLSSRGADMTQIETMINLINEGTDLDIDMDDVTNALSSSGIALDVINQKLAVAQDLTAGGVVKWRGLGDTIGGLIPQVREAQNAWTDVAEALVDQRIREGPEAFAEGLAAVRSEIEGTGAENFFIDEVMKSFDAATDGSLGFSSTNTSTFNALDKSLQENLPFWEKLNEVIDGTDLSELEDFVPPDLTGGLPSDIEQFGVAYVERLPGIIELTDTQLQNLTKLKEGIDGVLAAGDQYIVDHFNTMNAQISGQIPLLTTYSGAVDQTFAAWQKGQEEFVKDLGLIDDAREKMVAKFGPDSDLVDAFDQAPITEQAWLAQLAPENFEKALTSLQTSQDAAAQSVANRMKQDQEEIVNGVQDAMNTAYAELLTEAQANGAGVAELWQIWFDRKSDTWVTTAENVMTEISKITGQPIDGPVVGPITFSGGGNPTNAEQSSNTGGGGDVNITVNNPNVNNLTGDTQRAVGIVKTAQSLRHT